MSDDFFERRVGTVVGGKWTLEKLLGVGGMAAVYLGRHHIGHRDAIKVLHPSAGRSSEMRARFEQEARAVGKLGHRGAVRIEDIDAAEDGSLYLVMELLEGESLGDRLQRGGATAEDALAWADELLDVLGAAHALDIVHRDVKPDNVFLLTSGRVKLLDFGIARMRDEASLKTATGVALGTLPYMAPEQVRGEAVDPRADLFAVGATLVRAIARRAIHEAGSDAELYLKMGSIPAPPASALLPSASPELWALVDHALAFDRTERYASAREMREDVQALRAGRPPEHALAAERRRPVPAVSRTLESTVRDVAADAQRTSDPAPARPGPSRRMVAVLVGSVLAGVGVTVCVLLLVSRGCGGATGGPAPVASSGIAPSARPDEPPPSPAAPPTWEAPRKPAGPGPRGAPHGKGDGKKKKKKKD